MVVMVTATARRLEARDAVADVDALDEPQRRERLERPVDARDPDGATLPRGSPRGSPARRGSIAARRGSRRPPCGRRRGGGPAALSPASAWSDQVIAQMISILNLWYARAAVLSRIVLVCAARPRSPCRVGLRRERPVGGRRRRRLLSARLRGGAGRVRRDRGRRPTPPGAEPHDLELTARDVERSRTRRSSSTSGGGFQPAVEDAVDGPRRGRRSTSSTTVRAGRRRDEGRRPARLARSDPLRAGRARDRRRARATRRRRTRLVAAARDARPASSAAASRTARAARS